MEEPWLEESGRDDGENNLAILLVWFLYVRDCGFAGMYFMLRGFS